MISRSDYRSLTLAISIRHLGAYNAHLAIEKNALEEPNMYMWTCSQFEPGEIQRIVQSLKIAPAFSQSIHLSSESEQHSEILYVSPMIGCAGVRLCMNVATRVAAGLRSASWNQTEAIGIAHGFIRERRTVSGSRPPLAASGSSSEVCGNLVGGEARAVVSV